VLKEIKEEENIMKMEVSISKKVLVRYAEVVCRITDQKIDTQKDLWDKELQGETKQGPFAMKMYESVHEEDRTVHFSYGVNDEFIMDVLNIVDKHGDNLKSIVKGFVAIYEGTKGFVAGFMNDVKAAAKKYNVRKAA
jgi:hypothetical protein